MTRMSLRARLTVSAISLFALALTGCDTDPKDTAKWSPERLYTEAKEEQAAGAYELGPEERDRVVAQADAILQRIDSEPKSIGWKMRAKVGDRKKWYRDVGELAEHVQEL